MHDAPIARRQLYALGTMIFLAPALRLFPAQSAELAGRGAWLCPLPALPLLLGWGLLLTRLAGLRREGETLAELAERLGGRGALLLAGLWALVYAAFVLRAGADRFVGTVYPRAPWRAFAVTMALAAFAAALSTDVALCRLGRLLQSLLLPVLAVLLGCALCSARLDNLLPLTAADAPGTARGALTAVDVISCPAAALLFLPRPAGEEKTAFRSLAVWMAALCGVLALLAAAVIGVFGHELAARLARPFFVLVRTLSLFGSMERFEALVVMLWIFPDFLTAGLFLRAASRCARRLLGFDPDAGCAARLESKNGRFLIWACAGACALLACLLAPDARSLERWSTALIPALNLGFCFVFLPGLYLLGSVGKRQ